MTTLQKERSVEIESGSREAVLSPDLARMLEEIERDSLAREQAAQRVIPTTQRTPRPFAYD